MKDACFLATHHAAFLLPPVTFSLLEPNNLVTTLFSHNVCIRSCDLNFGHFPSFQVTENQQWFADLCPSSGRKWERENLPVCDQVSWERENLPVCDQVSWEKENLPVCDQVSWERENLRVCETKFRTHTKQQTRMSFCVF